MPYSAGPFDSPHWYLQWGGKLPGNEQWSCGLRMAHVGEIDADNDPAMLAAASAAVRAYHVNGAAFISQAAKLSFVKLNLVGVDGHYVEDTTFEVVHADVPGGGPGSTPYPNQVALAVTLTTGFSRGPAHKGRFYLPLPGFVLGTDGTIAATNAAGLSTATDTFIAALNAMNSFSKVAVMSRKAGAPAHRLVTGNLVGRILDTQRRRRRSLVEDYQ